MGYAKRMFKRIDSQVHLKIEKQKQAILIGWDTCSYGYHGDDGHFFSSSGNGQPYGEKFSTGDTIGCGINMIENSIFFTKNGALQGLLGKDKEKRQVHGKTTQYQ